MAQRHLSGNTREIIRELRQIPGLGPSIAQDLLELGYQRIGDLKGADPEEMYERFMRLKGMHVDRCLLYVFRCAVYFASRSRHDPERATNDRVLQRA